MGFLFRPVSERTWIHCVFLQFSSNRSSNWPGPAHFKSEAKLAKSRTICHALRVPKVLEKDGFVFFFYSNDDAPIDIHVRRGGGEAVFDLDNDVELRESQGMKLSDIAKAEAIATEYKQLMIKKWHEHLDR